MNRVCFVDGCPNFADYDGKCKVHYMRFKRRGVYTKKGTVKQATESFIHKVVSDYFLGILSRSSCKLWPYGKSDQCWGQMNGKSITGHSYIAKMAISKPENKHMIAHRTCGNKKCVNPYHIKWKKFDNRRKITKKMKDMIKLEQGTVTKIAAKYKLHYATVSKIRNGKYE